MYIHKIISSGFHIPTPKIKYPSVSNIHFGMLTWCYVNIAGIKLKVDQLCNDVYNFHFSDNHHKQAQADRKKKIAKTGKTEFSP